METQHSFSGSKDVFEYISGFINLEKGQTSRSFRLDRMEILAKAAGNPEKSAPVIHIAGSKGKGSVTAMISSILSAAGFRTARYSSPHIEDYRERITLDREFFGETVYTEAGNELRRILESLNRPETEGYQLFDPSAGEEPTFFELFTLYFFLCARNARCDAMAVETGMGGRLDATNIVDPLASVITAIELEHTEYLGNTLEKIAGEKAGIVKPGRPVVLAEQESRVLDVFRNAAGEKYAPLLYVPDIAVPENIRVTGTGTSFTVRFLKTPLFPEPLNLWVPLPGAIQARNGIQAILAAKTAFPDISAEAVEQGLRSVYLPGRFETVSRDPLFIIDGAHTPKSIELTRRTFTDLYGSGGILLFGCAAGKDAGSMAELLLPFFSRIIITTPGTFKASNPQEIFGIFKSKGGTGSAAKLELIADTSRAVEQALAAGRNEGLPILGTGSFYLAAEIRRALKGRSPEF
ncbi:bifunctional folylpolyglutamate synthase/dihydrofolate synthase [Breznakiella homolactica]|uniref:Dihydrofolate synthase/folylpolyglutamate synthase n=1 Tax=Breznakiella homolactica TaxID=2798577 RepID=A0A7T7XKJ0_9SPIR|nr:folylpolyglutamate synthase/dihydrofolate synthase family protein [Breznakiella homolactica]QQO08041.1 bifunctional folylpolyglutamate synthase/dihydrofolate synthase [Breznakiella homolactica]